MYAMFLASARPGRPGYSGKIERTMRKDQCVYYDLQWSMTGGPDFFFYTFY